MKDSIILAWKYMRFYRLRTLLLLASVTLISGLPFTLETFLTRSETQLMDRAESTALIVGAKGSQLDLVLNSLYFGEELPPEISLQAADEVQDSGLAHAIPLFVRFRARGFPIVGTNIDYFEYRSLELSSGRSFAMLGEAVIGARVASKLALAVGDTIDSSPENPFDLAGVYPLRLQIRGVLEESGTPDDRSVFVDLKTAWIISGLGHGHQDLEKVYDPTLVLKRDGKTAIASAKLKHYQEITDQNRDSFHFHGDSSRYPITAVIAAPFDSKSATILQGRYLNDSAEHQIVDSKAVVAGLLENIFKIRNILDGAVGLVAIATLLALILVFSLSLRLRASEFHTVSRMGGSRTVVAELILSEIGTIIFVSIIACFALSQIVSFYADDLLRFFIIQ